MTTTSGGQYNLMDVNADGLPDKVKKNNGTLSVSLNLGNGFADPILWKGASSLSETASTSESGNVAFTVNFTPKIIPVKVTLNPNVSLGHSINRTHYSLQDVDGDGYLDILESDKEDVYKRQPVNRSRCLRWTDLCPRLCSWKRTEGIC